jgi:hypothetical protein
MEHAAVAIETPRKKQRKGNNKIEPKTVEVELGGEKVLIAQQTMPTGIVPLPRFVRRLAKLD